LFYDDYTIYLNDKSYDNVCELSPWFLRLGAPVFAAHLLNYSTSQLLKVSLRVNGRLPLYLQYPTFQSRRNPAITDSYRLPQFSSRCLEKHVVRSYIYPALHLPHPGLSFDDQFAFRPSGSTTAAVVALLHTVRVLLSSNQFVRVFSFDFTKAFDTVRHVSVMTKMAQMQITDTVCITGSTTSSTNITTARDMQDCQDSVQQSRKSRQVSYKVPVWIQLHISSRQQTCSPSQQGTTSSNTRTTRTWLFPL